MHSPQLVLPESSPVRGRCSRGRGGRGRGIGCRRCAAAKQMPRDLRPARSDLRRARVCQCSQDRGPVAFSRGELAAQKCNRAARSGAFPISARYRRRRNPLAPAGCGNKRSRSPHKFSGRARPCRISARDKCPCLLRPPADRDGRFGNSGSRSARSTKRRRCRRCREREPLPLSYVLLHRLLFLRIQECRHARGPPEAEKHQAEMKRENEMRDREKHSGHTAPAEIRQDGISRLTERKRRIVHAVSLGDTAKEQHCHHQADAVGRRPEVQLDQGWHNAIPGRRDAARCNTSSRK